MVGQLGSRLFLARCQSGRGISVQRFIGTVDARVICAQNAKTDAIVNSALSAKLSKAAALHVGD